MKQWKRTRNRSFTAEWRKRERANQTPAEKELWNKLRAKRFFGYIWRRQVAILKYVVDFYCASAKLVIELDGSIHDKPERQIHDAERTRLLNGMGIKVIRFRNEQVLNDWDGVSDAILDELLERDPETFIKGVEC